MFISMPQPKIMNPSDASLALPGNDTYQLLSHVSMPEPMKASLTP